MGTRPIWDRMAGSPLPRQASHRGCPVPCGCIPQPGPGPEIRPLQSWVRQRQAQVSTAMLGYTFRTTFRFSSRKRTPRELILSGTQQGSGTPGTMPTALTMLWMVAWLDGRTTCKAEGDGRVISAVCPLPLTPYSRRGTCSALPLPLFQVWARSLNYPLFWLSQDRTTVTQGWPLGGARVLHTAGRAWT